MPGMKKYKDEPEAKFKARMKLTGAERTAANKKAAAAPKKKKKAVKKKKKPTMRGY